MEPFSYWLHKNWYYHHRIKSFYQFIIQKNASVLQINCKNGYLLDAINPGFGVGIDEDTDCIEVASNEYPQYQFFQCILDDLTINHQFDYIILSIVTMEVDDVQQLFEQIHRFCHPGTRIILETYSYLWEPILWLTQKLGLRRPTKFKNWMSCYDLRNFLYLAGFDVVTTGSYMLIPMYIPIISWLFNTFIAPIPFIRSLCLHQWLIARPMPQVGAFNDYSVSVIVTVRNEKGNIERTIKECPRMGKHTEIIFVEGGSTDGTLQEVKHVIATYNGEYEGKNLRFFVQEGKGKGDAVRKGFANAHGDVLMILDGDLTTPPHELPKFFQALVSSKGEFINGSRLVYGMEDKAMRFLNLLANYGFSVIFSWILSQHVKDTLCGTKVLWKKDYERLAAERSYFGSFDPFGDFDLLFGAAKLNLKIIDLPIRYKSRTYGKSNIRRFWCGIILVWMSFIGMRKFKFR